MALSVVDLYRDVLPRTNCGDCGFPTCIAFAGMVVSDKHPLDGCPHLAPAVVERCTRELGVPLMLLFDETVTDHLDIESIVFLSERLRQMRCDAADETK